MTWLISTSRSDHRWLKRFCAALLFLGTAQTIAAERTYYRYTNDKGHKVINFSIPAKYVPKGYEVVTSSGRVVEVVPPAPTEQELALAEADKIKAEEAKKAAEEQAKHDKYLLRRYSTPKDIEAAKGRKLAELDANISILKGNLHGLKVQVENQHAVAADHERAGRKAPQTLVDNLAILEEEIANTESQIGKRQQEYDEVANRYDRDIERFKVLRPGR